MEYFSGAVWLEVTEIDNDPIPGPGQPQRNAGRRIHGHCLGRRASGATGYDVKAKAASTSGWITVASNITATSYRYTTSPRWTTPWGCAPATPTAPARGRNCPARPNENWLNTVQQSGGASLQMAESQAQGQSQLSAPASVTVTRDNYWDDEKLYVSWSAVSGAGGYNLACSDTGGWNWWNCGAISSGTTTTFTVDNDTRNGQTRDLIWTRAYMVSVRAVTSNASDASAWVNSDNALPALQPSPQPPGFKNPISYSRGNGSVTVSWTSTLGAQGYEIDCTTFENNASGTYTLCADVNTATVTNGKVSATISSWTVSGTNYSIDNTKTIDLKVRTTNAWGESPDTLAPLIDPITLTASNIEDTAATLTLANYSPSWHYKYTTPNGGTCSSAQTGETAEAINLTAGTTYTFKAYTDSTCSTELVTAANFTTPSLTSSNVADTTATITIANYTSSWWYKADTGPHSTCQGSVSSATVNLTNLVSGAPYTYTAYRKTGCKVEDKIASVYFTTTSVGLTVTNVTTNSATLAIAGHSTNWYYKANAAPHATCQGPVTGSTSVSLVSLTSGTAYTYTAYSDSGCSTSLATAAQFTTAPHATNLNSVKSGASNILSKMQQAVAFSTGSNANGYTLTSVTLPLRQIVSGGSLSLALHTMDGNTYSSTSAPSATAVSNATLSGTAPTGAAWSNTTYTCAGSGCSHLGQHHLLYSGDPHRQRQLLLGLHDHQHRKHLSVEQRMGHQVRSHQEHHHL